MHENGHISKFPEGLETPASLASEDAGNYPVELAFRITVDYHDMQLKSLRLREEMLKVDHRMKVMYSSCAADAAGIVILREALQSRALQAQLTEQLEERAALEAFLADGGGDPTIL